MIGAPPRGSRISHLNATALWTGLTTYIFYVFGGVPILIASTYQMGLDAAQASSWMFIANFCAAASSVTLSLVYRQPLPVAWSIPGVIYLTTLTGRFSYAEIMGANLLAGVVIVALGLMGAGGRIMALLPLPITLGMFAGSTLANVTAMVKATVADGVVAGATVAGYLLGRALPRVRIPPLALSLVCGAAAILVTQRASPEPVQWGLPALVMPEMQFTLNAFVAITIPLVILAVGLGNVQGLGFLMSQGYRVPVNVVTVVLGGLSCINALFGGNQAIVARAGAAMLASPEAGPREGRFWANIVSGGLMFVTAFAATPLASLLRIVPASFVATLAGLAILASFQESLVRAVSGHFRTGSLIAFLVAATPFDVLGLTSAFWALVAGLAVSGLVEREDFSRS